MRYDAFADFHMNIFCNFRCKYCYVQSRRKQHPAYRGHDAQRILDGFDRTGLTWFINMTGGEPFMQPDFLRLCAELTKKHYISVLSNLASKLVYDFPKQVNLERVAYFHCALHIDERERLGLVEDFVEKCRYLREHGLRVLVTQVAYPPVVKRMEEIHHRFREMGIVVKPKLFRGVYRFNLYPLSYTPEERKTLLRLFELSREPDDRKLINADPELDKKLLYGMLSFRGLPCRAGKEFVVIRSNGTVTRCLHSREVFGNLLRDKIALRREIAPCPGGSISPHYCLMFAQGEPKLIKHHSVFERGMSIARNLVGLFR